MNDEDELEQTEEKVELEQDQEDAKSESVKDFDNDDKYEESSYSSEDNASEDEEYGKKKKATTSSISKNVSMYDNMLFEKSFNIRNHFTEK